MFRMFILGLTVFCHPAFAAFQEGAAGPVACAMGGASCAVLQSPWGVLANPSLLSCAGSSHLTASVSPHRFGLSELAVGKVLAVLPTTWGTFGISGSHEGFELYREVVAAVSGGWRVASGLHAGVSVRYYHLAIKGYGVGHSLGIQAGFLLSLHRVVSFGFSAGNINAPVIGQSEERLPQLYRTGIAVKPVEDLEIALDVTKDILHPVQVHAGFQYRLLRELVVRGGTGVEPSSFTAGLGVHWATVTFDYAFSHHPVLGLSHFFSAGIGL